MLAERVLSDFEGRWSVARQIVHDEGPEAGFSGVAQWARAKGGMSYVEEGKLQVGTLTPMHAQRSYFWDEALNVWFDDGRFFHAVPVRGGETKHWCDPDSYHVVYNFENWPRFETVWSVTGPKKAYRMTTVYTPLEGNPLA